MAALTGPRQTPRATKRDFDRWDRKAPSPLLREAAKDMHERSLADPLNARLRDAALLLNVIDMALVRGSSTALDVLAGAIKNVEKKEPGVAWGMSSSGAWSMRPLPLRKGKSERAPRMMGMLLIQAESMVRKPRWPPETIASLLGAQIAQLFPQYATSRAQVAAAIQKIETLSRELPPQDASEKLLVLALRAFGMPSTEAQDRLKGALAFVAAASAKEATKG
jgi:hypothetical protein